MDRVDLYCQITREKYLSQEWLNREFGTKAGAILSIGAAVVGAGTVIFTLSEATQEAPFWVFLGLICTFLVVATLSVYILSPRQWYNGPNVTDLASRLDSPEEHDLTKLVGDVYADSVKRNKSVLDAKGVALQWGAISLAVESTLLASLGALSYFYS